MKFSRRQFIQVAGSTALLSSSHSVLADFFIRNTARRKIRKELFLHGVASGDPQQDRVIIWSRVSPSERGRGKIIKRRGRVIVKWRIALDAEFQNIVQQDFTIAQHETDFTVKIDVAGLSPGTTYYYQFSAMGELSPVGRTKTLPTDQVEHLRIALTSCSNYPFGYFNVYRMIAQRNDLDAVLHLGDYIYEYANGTYGDGEALDRVPEPNAEILTLQDYRTRFAQYRTDPDLQEAHRQHPFITVWDDHETADNAWRDGAENHNPELGEGDWFERRVAAIKAYYEWMPIRQADKNNPLKSYRKFQFGNLLDLMMLDTRLYGRDQQVTNGLDPLINDPNRKLLGDEQQQWLLDSLDTSHQQATRWRMLGQQVMFGQLLISGQIFNVDQWDGYPASRQRVIDHLRDNQIDNTIILTGDIHSSWAMDITDNPFDPSQYDPQTGSGSVAVEFVTPAVTSPGITDKVVAQQNALFIQSTSPHIRYIDLFYRGYVLLDINHERTQAEWYHAETIEEQNNTNEVMAAAYQVRDQDNYLTIAEDISEEKANQPAPAP